MQVGCIEVSRRCMGLQWALVGAWGCSGCEQEKRSYVGAVMPSFSKGVEAAWNLLELQQGSCTMEVVACGVGSSEASSSFFPVLAMEPYRSG
ncbi:unnamed protein product [Camellia sinensis]